MRFRACCRLMMAGLLLAGLATPRALGQSAPFEILEPVDVGVGGYVQRGQWAPLRLRVRNNTSRPRQVICQWALSDHDGDVPHFQKRVTLPQQATSSVWLYAPLPVRTDSNTRWRLMVLDAPADGAAGDVLASLTIAPPSEGNLLLGVNRRIVGVTGTNDLGLSAYTLPEALSSALQHEVTEIVRGVDPANLPDQWQGLAMLSALIWEPGGPDPSAASVAQPTQEALLQWIARGGHLVIIMPAFGNPWADSFLGDAFPRVHVGTLANETLLPPWIGPNTPVDYAADFRTFEPVEGTSPAQVTVLLRHRGEPLVVTSNHGFGRITLVGVDVTDRRLLRMGQPNMEDQYERGLWGAVFGWRMPAWSSTRIRRERENNRIVAGFGAMTSPIELDEFIGRRIAMTETAATALLAAMLVFLAYWLAAGPVGFAVIKARGKTHHAWVVFALVVAIFTVVTWGGAALIRPRQSRVQHFSVVDVDAGQNLMRVHSWATLFLPVHRLAAVEVHPDEAVRGGNTIASVGLSAQDRAAFLDSQDYLVWTGRTHAVAYPMRATARQLEIRYLGAIPNPQSEHLADWVFPPNRVRLVDGRVRGELMHNLPGTLRDVMLVYVPGGEADSGQPPLVWRPGEREGWAPESLLKIDQLATAGTPLVRRPADAFLTDPEARSADRRWQGHLGQLVHRDTTLTPRFGDTNAIHMLSFYDALPPPDFRRNRTDAGGFATVHYFVRGAGRHLDLTPRLATRCLIVIGVLEDAPLPLPLTADGETVNARGTTVVRWICPVE